MSAWQPIESAPKNPSGEFYGPSILVWSDAAVGVFQAYWGPSRDDATVGDWIAYEDGKEIADVTHWMPLPPHPAEDTA